MTNVTRRNLGQKRHLGLILWAVVILLFIDYSIEIFYFSSTMKEIFIDSALELPRLFILLYALFYIHKLYLSEGHRKVALEKSLVSSQREATMWEQKSRYYLKEFASYIESEFDRWNLTKSEREVALLIIRGKSSKDIAALRFTSDRTIRNQCQSIYEKSGLAGRHELSAYFLEKIIPGQESVSE